ncbi:MAG: glycosyltransferase [Propionibacteriaceae bacterium]
MNHSLPSISLIVPIYNVEQYLARCLDSILAQDYPNLEVILVNDGSPDSSAQIIVDYDAAHPGRFRVHTQENQGLGAARNNGVVLATGEFVAFMDSDDWIEPRFISDLAQAAVTHNADIAVCSNYCDFERGPCLRYPFLTHHAVMTGEQAAKRSFDLLTMPVVAWNKLYRKSLFTDNDIAYPSIYYEDIATTGRLLAKADRVAVVRKPLYHYCYRATGITGRFSQRNIDSYLSAISILRDFLYREGLWDSWQGEYQRFLKRARVHMHISTYFQDKTIGLRAKHQRMVVVRHDLKELALPPQAQQMSA